MADVSTPLWQCAKWFIDSVYIVCISFTFFLLSPFAFPDNKCYPIFINSSRVCECIQVKTFNFQVAYLLFIRRLHTGTDTDTDTQNTFDFWSSKEWKKVKCRETVTDTCMNSTKKEAKEKLIIIEHTHTHSLSLNCHMMRWWDRKYV